MNEVKLKPCPFCGGEASVCKCHGQDKYFAVCELCGASVGNASATREAAKNAWNTRVEQVAVKRGKWLEIGKITIGCGDSGTLANCSVCGAEVVLCDYDNYCPACGADMVGDSE